MESRRIVSLVGLMVLAVTFIASPVGSDSNSLNWVWVTTFDKEFINWASPHIQTFEFPPESSWCKIMLFYTIECPGPPGDCDPWDRLGHIRVVDDPGGDETHYEIARVITPYDITGGTRPGSCTWVLDVTDYKSLLHDTVTLRNFISSWIGGDKGWLVTVRFAFVPGITETEPYLVQNLWTNDGLVYGDPARPIEDNLQPIEVDIPADAVAVKVRAIATGHGQGNTNNAAEFSYKWHEVMVNDDSYLHYLWRTDCRDNTCSPQGGTWTYSRAGWCPGDKVTPWDNDVTGSVTPGTTAIIDYNVQPYENFCRPDNPDCVSGSTCPDCNYNSTGHTQPNYALHSQIIFYRETTYNRDILAGGGPGSEPLVSIFGRDGSGPHALFNSYEENFTSGIFVTAGTLNGTCAVADDVVVGPDGCPTPGCDDGRVPEVNVYAKNGVLRGSFLAEGQGFRGGIRVATGDLDGDGWDEIITGLGPAGRTTTVKVWNRSYSLLRTIVPFEGWTGGVFVASGDVDHDGFDEIVVAKDSGRYNESSGERTPLVKIYDYQQNAWIGEFQVFSSTFKGGVRVACGELDGSLGDEIVVAAGKGGGPHVRVFNLAGQVLNQWRAYQTTWRGGIYVGAGDACPRAGDEVVTGPEQPGGPHIRIFHFDGTVCKGNIQGGTTNPRSGIRVGVGFFGFTVPTPH